MIDVASVSTVLVSRSPSRSRSIDASRRPISANGTCRVVSAGRHASAGRERAEDRLRSVQLLEVGPAKDIVWMLSQWSEPHLGPASFFHVLTS